MTRMTTIRWLIRKARCKRKCWRSIKLKKTRYEYQTLILAIKRQLQQLYCASWSLNLMTNIIIFMHNMRGKGKSKAMMQRMGRSPINFKDPTSPAHVCSLIVITFFSSFVSVFSSCSRLKTCFTFSKRFDFSHSKAKNERFRAWFCYKEIVDFNFFYIEDLCGCFS